MDVDLEAARALWSRGSYAISGDWFAEASRACLDGLELDGGRLLDVACGTGAVALEAGRRGARVVGLDATPAMLDEARRRAAEEGLDVEWREGSFTDLSAFRDFDVVSSAFGVIFAEDQPAVAEGLLRAARPGGTVALAAWTPGRAFGGPSPQILELVPEAANRPDTARWGSREGLSGILAGVEPALGAELTSVTSAVVALPFPSLRDAAAEMRRWSAPWIATFEVLEARGLADRGLAVMLDHFGQFSRPEGAGIAIDVDYVVARVRRSGS